MFLAPGPQILRFYAVMDDVPGSAEHRWVHHTIVWDDVGIMWGNVG